jgi:cellulose synthase operon protein C
MSRIACAALLLGALLCPARPRAGLSESWYLSRARANVEIRNYAAAIEAYRKALAANPRSREASRGVGLALLGNGDTDLAVAELDRHLSRFPDDAELAFEQARLLQWSRYAYRSKDAIRYLRMGLAVRDDPARRRDLARLLARDRGTLDGALAEYDRLLAATPGDAALRDERLKLLLWDPGRREEAIGELRRRRAEAPGDARATRDLARLLATDPRTAGEAAELHAELLARRPDDPELRLGHARALARAGRRAEARDAYTRALAAKPTLAVRLERADLLAADPATRDAARAEYEAVLGQDPGSRKARIGLARILGARKETSPDAIAQYQAVLARSPADAEAHRGLARAYAWNGDADRALAHGDLAARHGPVRPELAALERDLRRGREPAMGGGARLLAQPGGAWELSRVTAFASGAAEPTPFTSSAVEAGFASAEGAGGARAEGPFVVARGEWRPSPEWRLALTGAFEGVRTGGRAHGAIRLERRGATAALSLGARRTPRDDSFRAFAGEVVDGRTVGAVSDQVVEARLAFAEEATRWEVSGRAGAVSGPGLAPVLTAEAAARVERTVRAPGAFELSLAAMGEAVHHARDLGGLGAGGDPAAPRIFSPPLYATLSPRLLLARDDGLRGHLALEAGPSLQLVTGPGGGAHLGAEARLAVVRRLGDHLRLSAGARAERFGATYTRYEASAAAEVLFP